MKIYFKPFYFALLAIILSFSTEITHAQTFTTVASATSQGNNCWQLTPNINNRNGAIWNTQQINLNNPFDITFHITQTTTGADGMAFVLQQNGTNVIGGGGSNCGYAGGSITNSVAVELDIWNNSPAGIDDISNHHIAVHQNGNLTSAIAGPVNALTSGGLITDGVCRELNIIWDPVFNNLQVFFAGVQRLNITYNIRTPFGGNPNVYFGMTAATGGVSTAQTVCYEFAQAGADTAICNGTSLQLNGSGGTTYNWAPPVAINNATISNPIFTPVFGPTTYGYQLSVTNSAGCMDVDTILIDVEPVPTANAGNDVSICPGNSAQIGTAPVAGLSYSWSPTTGLNDPNAARPLASPPNSILYTVTVTDTTGGAFCSSTDQVNVNVFNGPTADAGSDASICSGDCASIGNAPVAGTTYSWSPSTGLSAANIANPTACPTTTQSYVVTATLTSTGCTDIDTVTVTVNTPPVADAGPDIDVCEGQCATIGTAGQAGFTYNWSPASDLSSPTSANPTCCPTATRTYTLIVTETATSCSDTDMVVVTMNANPIINLGPDTSVCEGSCLQIGGAPIPGMSCTWSPATGLNDPNISNPVACPTTDICYTVACTMNTTGCISSDTICITVDSLPFVEAGPDQSICPGDTTQLAGNAAISSMVSWGPIGGLNDPTSLTPSASPGATTDYVLTATDASGCLNADTVTVTVFPAAIAGFNFGTSQLQVTFGNTSTSGTYFWEFGDGDTDTATAPVHTYGASGTYTVCLTVTDANGCDDSLCQDITVMGVGLQKPDLAGLIKLYPNPGTGLFHLEMEGLGGNMAAIRVYNPHGQTVYQLPEHTTSGNTLDLDLRNVTGGIYFVEIKTSLGNAVLKVVKR